MNAMNPVDFITSCMRGFIINDIDHETAVNISNTITAYYSSNRTVYATQEEVARVLELHNYKETGNYEVKIYTRSSRASKASE